MRSSLFEAVRRRCTTLDNRGGETEVGTRGSTKGYVRRSRTWMSPGECLRRLELAARPRRKTQPNRSCGSFFAEPPATYPLSVINYSFFRLRRSLDARCLMLGAYVADASAAQWNKTQKSAPTNSAGALFFKLSLSPYLSSPQRSRSQRSTGAKQRRSIARPTKMMTSMMP